MELVGVFTSKLISNPKDGGSAETQTDTRRQRKRCVERENERDKASHVFAALMNIKDGEKAKRERGRAEHKVNAQESEENTKEEMSTSRSVQQLPSWHPRHVHSLQHSSRAWHALSIPGSAGVCGTHRGCAGARHPAHDAVWFPPRAGSAFLQRGGSALSPPVCVGLGLGLQSGLHLGLGLQSGLAIVLHVYTAPSCKRALSSLSVNTTSNKQQRFLRLRA